MRGIKSLRSLDMKNYLVTGGLLSLVESCNDTSCGLSFFTLRSILCFLPFLRIFKSKFLIQDLISRLIINENGISMLQTLSLGVEHFAFIFTLFNCHQFLS